MHVRGVQFTLCESAGHHDETEGKSRNFHVCSGVVVVVVVVVVIMVCVVVGIGGNKVKNGMET